MSDDLERRLREAGHRLPGPTDTETQAARSGVLGTRRRSRRRLLPVLAAAVLAGGAFGVGYAVAAGGKEKPTPKLVVEHVPTRLNSGPGFVPAQGWTTTASATTATARSANGVSIVAHFFPASTKPAAPQRLLPLRLPAGEATRHLVVHVGAYVVDVTVGLPSNPSAALLASAREELGRLIVPSCPVALPLAPRHVDQAARYLRKWLPSHYDGNPADVAGALMSVRVGQAMPRHGEAQVDCGAAVAARSVEIDVILPKVSKVSASLSELTFFVAKTSHGWVVWERAR